MTPHLQTANTILEQLGGRRFCGMTGAKQLTAGREGLGSLTMRLPSNLTTGRITHLRVTLTPADLYKVETFKRGAFTVVADDVYCDQLVTVFEEATGLLTHL